MRLVSQIYRHVAHLLPNGPIILHLGDVDILNAVHIESDLGDSLVALGLMHLIAEALQLARLLEFENRGVVREFLLGLQVFEIG